MTVLDLVTGLPITSSDALGRETTFEYDAGGRQTSMTGPDGLETTTSYTAASGTAPSTRTDTTPDGRVVRRTYDALGRHARVTDNVSGQAFTSSATARQLAAMTYSVDGTKMTAVDQQGRTTTSEMDVLGRQVRSIVDKTGIAHETAYDDVAHTTTRTVDPAGAAAVSMTRLTSYDDGNRQVSELQSYLDPGAPASQQYSDPLESIEYDGLGRPTSRTDSDLLLETPFGGRGGSSPTQKVTPQATNAFPGQAVDLSRTATLAGRQTSSTRSVDGGSAAQGADLTYDAVGRQQTSTDPLGRTTTWTYHDDGDVATRTSELGTVLTDTYDDTTGRLLSVEANPAQGDTLTRTYTYVPAGQPGAGRVQSVTDESGLKVSLAYDADGHVVKRSYSDGTATSATYSDNGLVATTTDVTGAVTTYSYDTAGRMQTVTQRRGSAVLATVTYTYDGMSRVLTTTRGNQTTTTNTYTGRNQVATQTTTTATGALVESHAYTYDTHGNVASRTDTTPTAAACSTTSISTPCPAPTTAGTWTTTYGYDAYDRLLSSATYAGPLQNPAPTPTTSTSYTLDVDGDVVGTTTTTRRTVGGRPLVTTSRVTNTIDDAGQLTARTTGSAAPVPQVFDADGRLRQSLTGAALTYDALDRVTTATVGGATTSYGYWPDGSRRQATTTGPSGTGGNNAGPTTLTYHYGPDGTLVNDSTDDSTTTGTTTVTASYLLTAGREARTLQAGTTATGALPTGAPAPTTTGAGVGYVLRDRHSSVTALVDSRGAVTNMYEYADYGAPALLDGRPAPLPAPRRRAGEPVPVHRRGAGELDDRRAHRPPAAPGAVVRPGPGTVHEPRLGQRLQPLPGLLDEPHRPGRPVGPHLADRHHHRRHGARGAGPGCGHHRWGGGHRHPRRRRRHGGRCGRGDVRGRRCGGDRSRGRRSPLGGRGGRHRPRRRRADSQERHRLHVRRHAQGAPDRDLRRRCRRRGRRDRRGRRGCRGGGRGDGRRRRGRRLTARGWSRCRTRRTSWIPRSGRPTSTKRRTSMVSIPGASPLSRAIRTTS